MRGPQTPERFQQLIEILIERTQAGSIKWDVRQVPRQVGKFSFSTSTTNSTITVVEALAFNVGPKISVLDQDGEVVEEYQSSFIPKFSPGSGGSLDQKLTMLVETLRRVTTEVDEFLSDVIADLKEPK